MADLTKEELRAALAQLGEPVPAKWTKAEITVRLEELTGEDLTVNVKKKDKTVSHAQMLAKDLNAVARRRKQELIAFCEKELKMSNLESWTMNRIQVEGHKKILAMTEGDYRDLVAFGKHGLLSYQEIYEQEPEYCRWVVQTAHERQELSDFRLRRLARWIVQQNEMELKPAENRPSVVLNLIHKAGYTATSSTSLSTPNKDERIEAMSSIIRNLQAEVQNLKDERAPTRKKGRETEKDKESESDGTYTVVSTSTTSPSKTT